MRIRQLTNAAANVALGITAVGLVVAGGVAIYSKAVGFGMVFNPSPSLARGFYIRTDEPVGIGSLVAFRLPEVMRDYMASVPGALAVYDQPGNGLLKPVAAVAGDVICRYGLLFSINGEVVAQALRAGPFGWLPSWQGCHVLGVGEIAVLSTRIADSDDSRYYSAIKLNYVVAYKPFLVER